MYSINQFNLSNKEAGKITAGQATILISTACVLADGQTKQSIIFQDSCYISPPLTVPLLADPVLI